MSPNSDLRHLKAHFFTASFVWRFRFVIFIALHLQSTNAFKQSKKETLYVVFGRRCTVFLWGQVLLDLYQLFQGFVIDKFFLSYARMLHLLTKFMMIPIIL